MTLEEYAFLAEIIGTILVVVSLIYVAQQLRQNTKMARIAASEQGVKAELDLTEPIIGNREFAEVWAKGDQQFDSLDEPDRWRLLFFERRAIVWWHYVYQLRQQGLYRDADWQNVIGIIRAVCCRQAIRESWSMFKDGFEKPFRDFLEEQFAIADGGAARD